MDRQVLRVLCSHQEIQGEPAGWRRDQPFLGQSSLPCGRGTAVRVILPREEADRVSGPCFQHELAIFRGEEHKQS